MAGRGAAILVVAMLCGVVTAGSAFAENVPVPPTPVPQPKGSAAPGITAPNSGQLTPAAGESKGFFPFSLPFGGSSPQSGAFDAKQKALLNRVSSYLSGVQTMVGKFVQIGPDGGRTEGTFYIQKPGKVRFEYNPPSPIDVIADGSAVVVRNRDLATQDIWPLSETPLRYLLADHIDLMRDTNVISVSADDKFITVVVEEKQVMVGTTKLMIMFDAKTSALKQWTVTDPQGLDTTVAVYNLDSTKKPNPDLFVINYQRNPGSFSNQ
jgi:outer membrane lipoprotein-sorting protein